MSAVVALQTPAEKALGEQFRSSGASDAGRRDAYAAFAAAGLPHRRIEAWHYTDLRALMREALPIASAPSAEVLTEARNYLSELSPAPGGRIIVLDGHDIGELNDAAALPAGVSVRPVLDAGSGSKALAEAHKLGQPESVVALNTALVQGGTAVAIAEGTKLAEPLEIVSLVSGRSPAAIYTRCTVEIGASASAAIVERHATLQPAKSQGNHVLILSIADGAELRHIARIDDLGADTLHVGSLLVRLGGHATFTSTTLIATRGTTRRQAYLDFAGPHAKAHFNGASLLDGRAHADTTLVVTHTAPHCESRELYKHVLDGEATGVYQGKVIVKPGAQKTDGKMLSKAVFLAEGATMHNKPELEIFADDVVCGHGATVGALDEDQLFYLRARGIPKSEAEAMLLEAFADEALDELADETLRHEFASRIAQWLRQRGS